MNDPISPEPSPAPAAPEPASANLDVLVITFNEAINLPHCLRALQGWTRRVFVIDSGSNDGTQAIAAAHGATVIHHAWPGYAAQKNWALENAGLEADWVLIVDADEIITPLLQQRIRAVVDRPPDGVPENGFFINRLTFFLDRPIRRCGYYPSWNMRLFKRGRGRYEDRRVHEHVIIDDPLGRIDEPMLHHDRRGLEHFYAKHNRYSTLEARQLFEEIRSGHDTTSGGLANVTAETRRRRWLKRHVTRFVPLPGLWRFTYMYLLKLGFLDGRPGYEFCKFIAGYDAMVALKLRTALKQSGQGAVDGAIQSVPALAQPEGTATAQPASEALAQVPAVVEPSRSPMPLRIDRVAGVEMSPEPLRPEVERIRAERPEIQQLPPGNWPAPRSVPVSILIPAKNERLNIVECIRHVLWAEEIVVVDSASSDETVPLAQAAGAASYQFQIAATGWPKKKNWALENVPWRNEWVMIIDADEHITPALAREIEEVVTGRHRSTDPTRAGCGDGYWVNRRFMFMGRWIKGCGYYPSWNVRLFKHRVGRYERIGMLGDTSSGDNEVHEHVLLSTGDAGYLRHEFLHYAYPDLATWIEKHNRYSTWEAFAMGAQHRGGVRAQLFGAGPIARRRWLKSSAHRLPCRPSLRFLFSYFAQRGFLDGYPGFVMCRLLAWYEFVSIAKHREMRRKA